MNSRKDILKSLLDDTMSDKIDWKITLEKDLVKASHTIKTTPNKTILFKIVYFFHHKRGTKLTIDYELKTEKSKHNRSIVDMGGRSNKGEVKEISFLMKKILQKKNYPNIDIFVDDNEFKDGDDVVVIKSEFDGKDIGKRGKIISVLFNVREEPHYIVQFDEIFDDALFDHESALMSGAMKPGDSWAYKPGFIKKI